MKDLPVRPSLALHQAIAALVVICSVWCGPHARANLLEQGALDNFSKGKFAGWHVPRADASGVFSHGMILQDSEQTAGEGGRAPWPCNSTARKLMATRN